MNGVHLDTVVNKDESTGWFPFGQLDDGDELLGGNIKHGHGRRRMSQVFGQPQERNGSFWFPFGQPTTGAMSFRDNIRGRGLKEISQSQQPDFFDRLNKKTEAIARNPPRRREPSFHNGFLDQFGKEWDLLRRKNSNRKEMHKELILQSSLLANPDFLTMMPPMKPDPEKAIAYKKQLDEQRSEKLATLNVKQDDRDGKQTGFFDKLGKGDFMRGRRRKPQLAKDPYDPWGKDVPQRDELGNVKRHAHPSLLNGVMHLAEQADKSGIEDIIPVDKELRKHSEKRNVTQSFDVYDPFGKPGAGAPFRDKSGKILTRLVKKTSDHEHRPPPNDAFMEEMKRAVEEHRKSKQQWHEVDTAPSEDFVDVIERSVVGRVKRNQDTGTIEASPRIVSDVIDPDVNEPNLEKMSSLQHLQMELKQQIDERRRQRQLEKQLERDDALQHYGKQNAIWSRPSDKPRLTSSFKLRKPIGDDEPLTKTLNRLVMPSEGADPRRRRSRNDHRRTTGLYEFFDNGVDIGSESTD